MKTKIIIEKDLLPTDDPVWGMTFSPDGRQLLSVCGIYIFVLDVTTAEFKLSQVKAHKDTIYAIAYCPDGSMFATGGADKTVKIWSPEIKGRLMYPHSSTVQCLAFNPVTKTLASGAENDLGIWQEGVAQMVVRWPIPGNWAFQWVSLYQGERWKVSEGDPKEGANLVLNVEYCGLLTFGCWDQTISFFDGNGKQMFETKKIDFDPCAMLPFQGGEYFILAGSNKEAVLFSREGIKLSNLSQSNNWIFSGAVRGRTEFIALPTDNARVAIYTCLFDTVHGLYQDQYTFRDMMTDVVVQSLTDAQLQLRISCNDCVQKIAVYKGRLAIQLSTQIVVYDVYTEQTEDEAQIFQYKMKHKFSFTEECSLLLATAQHVVVCEVQSIVLLDGQGKRVRDWKLDSVILYLKVIGGPAGRECLVAGLLSGAVHTLYVDSPFTTRILIHSAPVRCLDYSMSRSNLAVVDDNFELFVYEVSTQEVVLREKGVTGVAWNTEFEQMLCYSGAGMLTIKVADLPPYRQRMQGLVVGLKGSKVFCLRRVAMLTYDVPQSDALTQFVGRNDYESGYRVGCLGVTSDDWKQLGIQALRGLELLIAKKALLRAKEMRFLDLISELEQDMKRGNVDRKIMEAKVLAFGGEYMAAAQLYVSAGQTDRAVELFADLRDYESALQFAKLTGNQQATQKLAQAQAKWCEEIGKIRDAARVYALAQMPLKAVAILGERGLVDDLADIMRQLQPTDTASLEKCGEYFVRFKQHAYARETFMKKGDTASLVQLHVRLEEWENAIVVAEANPKCLSLVFLPYAAWLAEKGSFDSAQKAFHRAGRPDQAIGLLKEMSKDAINKGQYDVAARCLWMTALEFLSTRDPQASIKSEYSLLLAQIYFAYASINSAVKDPITTRAPSAVFNAGLFLCNTLRSEQFMRLHAHQSEMSQVQQNYIQNVETVDSSDNEQQDQNKYDENGNEIPIEFRKQYTNNQQLQKQQQQPQMMLSMITSSLPAQTPKGISYALILYALHRYGQALGAWRFVRLVCASLADMVLPRALASEVEVASLLVRGKPMSDAPHLTQFCWRCASGNALLIGSRTGDCCQYCRHTFIRSCISFLQLPLVEFFGDETLTDPEIEQLLRSLPPSTLASAKQAAGSMYQTSDNTNPTRRNQKLQKSQSPQGQQGPNRLSSANQQKRQSSSAQKQKRLDADGWQEENAGDGEQGYQRLSFNQNDNRSGSNINEYGNNGSLMGGNNQDSGQIGVGPKAVGLYTNTDFARQLFEVQHGDANHRVVLDKEGLRQMPPTAVHVIHNPPPLKWKFYANLAPDIGVVICSACLQFFSEDDFSRGIFEAGGCPFCGTALENLDNDIRKLYASPESDADATLDLLRQQGSTPRPLSDDQGRLDAALKTSTKNIKAKASLKPMNTGQSGSVSQQGEQQPISTKKGSVWRKKKIGEDGT